MLFLTGVAAVLAGVATAFHCDEAKTETQCDALLNRGIPCKWDSTGCNYVNCALFPDNSTCADNTRYGCEWRGVNDTLFADNNNLTDPLEFCYTDCPSNKSIVFVADVSSSVIADNATADQNVENYRRFITESMDLIWKTNEQYRVPTKVAFSLVLFAQYSLTIFDLSKAYSLDDYLKMTRAVLVKQTFQISSEFNDNTNTSGALNTALDIIQARSPELSSYQPMVVTVTDGKPNLPYPTSPCSPSYNIDERFRAMDVSASFALVGFNTTVFNCFLETLENHATILRVDDFDALRRSFAAMQSAVCPVSTQAPTSAPTKKPTPKPTPKPTSSWAKPTYRPTMKPTGGWARPPRWQHGYPHYPMPYPMMPMMSWMPMMYYPYQAPYQPRFPPLAHPHPRYPHAYKYFKNYYDTHHR